MPAFEYPALVFAFAFMAIFIVCIAHVAPDISTASATI